MKNYTYISQFSFNQSHGPEMTIFALKQTVDFYCNQETPVYMCFLDAKKAFDRVNHRAPAKKLLDRNALLYIVKLFIYWYRASLWHDGVTHYNDIPLFKWGHENGRVVTIAV